MSVELGSDGLSDWSVVTSEGHLEVGINKIPKMQQTYVTDIILSPRLMSGGELVAQWYSVPWCGRFLGQSH